MTIPTHLVCVFSDVHFNAHHPGAWAAFRQWHREHRPELSVALGDMIDLSMLSRYEQAPHDEVHAIVEIRTAVKELNDIRRECGRLVVLPGNHEDRWGKAVMGKRGPAFKDLTGLDLESQFRAQGLAPQIRWVNETKDNPGLVVGKQAVLVMHGHKQATGWGIINLAARNLRKFPTISTVVGHHHRAQHMTQTSLGRTVHAIANPHLSGSHDYNITPDWQRGFTVLEFYGRARLRDCVNFTPYVLVMDEKGRFCWKGKVYG